MYVKEMTEADKTGTLYTIHTSSSTIVYYTSIRYCCNATYEKLLPSSKTKSRKAISWK